MKKAFRKAAAVLTLSTALFSMTGCDLKVTYSSSFDNEEDSFKKEFNIVSYSPNGTKLHDYNSEEGISVGFPLQAQFGKYRVEQLGGLTAIQNGAKTEDFTELKYDDDAYKVTFYDPTYTKVIYQGYNYSGLSGNTSLLTQVVINGSDGIVQETGENVTAIKVKYARKLSAQVAK